MGGFKEILTGFLIKIWGELFSCKGYEMGFLWVCLWVWVRVGVSVCVGAGGCECMCGCG